MGGRRWAVTWPAGWHWAIGIGPLHVNIPYWPHRIAVIGRGRLTRRGTFQRWIPCCYRMHLDHCCPARQAVAGHERRPFEQHPQAGTWRARCACGWPGDWRGSPDRAQADHTAHARQKGGRPHDAASR